MSNYADLIGILLPHADLSYVNVWTKVREILFEIRGSHGGEDFDCGILSCDTISLAGGGYHRFGETYRLHGALKIEVVSSSKTLVTTYKATWRRNSDHNRHDKRTASQTIFCFI
jgi:hypothetical protein